MIGTTPSMTPQPKGDPVKILRVAQKVYPDVKGGGPYHVHAMSRDQAAMGHDVTVVTVDDDLDKPHIEERAGYTVIRYPSTVELLGNDISAGVGRYLASVDEFDVIHAHSHLYFSTNLAALKRRLGDISLAITNHGLYSQNAPEWVFNWYLKTAGRWTFNQADVVFCYTEEDKRRVQAFDATSRIEVVPNGVDTERFTPEGPTSDLIDPDGPAILFVGRLVEGKRPGDAIDAVEQVRENRPEATLYLCGEGPLRSDLEATSDDGVEFLGQIAYDEIPDIYRSGDALVLPSRAEGLPRTVLEAMASGIPVVCSDLEQVAPVVDRAGYTVPVGDVAGFAAALERLLDDSRTNRTLGNRGRALVEEGFEWDTTVERTTAVLAELADEPPT